MLVIQYRSCVMWTLFLYFVLHLSLLLGIIAHMYKISTAHTRRVGNGFTLIEILLAIGILAILATATIIAINPARQFAEARNTQRWNDVHAITNAVYQYAVGHKGVLPSTIPLAGDGLAEICITDSADCSGLLPMPELTTDAIYLTAIPVDPACPDACAPNGSGYAIVTTVDGRVQVVSLQSELGETIEVIR